MTIKTFSRFWVFSLLFTLFFADKTLAAVAGFSRNEVNHTCVQVEDGAEYETENECLNFNEQTGYGTGGYILTRSNLDTTSYNYTALVAETSADLFLYVADTGSCFPVHSSELRPANLSRSDYLNYWGGHYTPFDTHNVFAHYYACKVFNGATSSYARLSDDGYNSVYPPAQPTDPTPPDPDPLPNQECTITNLTGCFGLLFYPSKEKIEQLGNLRNEIAQKPPFGWFVIVSDMVNSIQLNLVERSSEQPVFLQELRDLIRPLIYLFLIFSLWHRIKHLQI